MHFNEVAQKTVVEEIRAGRLVFKEGERDNQSVYLLEGEISLLSGNDVVGSVTAGSDASRHPLAHQQPRQVTARAKTNLVVARVDSSLLDIMLTWDQSSGYEVSEIDDDEDDDWMTRILQSQAFLKLPPSNIQRLLMRVESIPVSAGEVIIQQGGEGDYFYIIKNGRCMVSRKPSPNAKEVKLAELGDGDAFGEDALVSDAKRNATITMISDGTLMRLAKKDFVELLKEPLLNKLSYPEAAELVKKGAVWLDVRLPGEFENVHIPDSRNIPLSALRLEANGLDAGSKYIVCCDTSRRSASAAFVLSQRGFDVYVLSDGLGGVPAEVLGGNAATVSEPASSAEVVTLKPHAAPVQADEVPVAAVTPDTGEITALQGQVESLQADKQKMESAQAQLSTRIGDLQQDLERVREEAREQILELEQSLAEARKETAAAQSKLLAAKDGVKGAEQQADQALREQRIALEAELAERHAEEHQLKTELTELKGRLSELEAAHQDDVRRVAEAEAAHSKLQDQLAALQTQASQADERLAQINALEAQLNQANQQGTQAQTDLTRRVNELEVALQAATSALEHAQQAQTELDATYKQELANAQSIADQQAAELREQLQAAQAEQADMAARLASANDAQQSDQQTQAELQAKIESLTTELDQIKAEHQAKAEAAASELAAMREAQDSAVAGATAEVERLRAEIEIANAAQAGLVAERDALQAQQEAAAREQAALQAELKQTQQHVEELQADAGEQVQHLESSLSALRQQLATAQQEQVSLQNTQAQLIRERQDMQTALEQSQERLQDLETQSAEQAQSQAAALTEIRSQLDVLVAERDRLQVERLEVDAKLAAAAARVDALEHSTENQSDAVSGLQLRLEEAQRELKTAQQTTETLQADYSAAQTATAELEAKLAAAEQAQLQVLAERQAELDATHAELAALSQTQTELVSESEQRIQALEASLAEACSVAEQGKAEQQQALIELQAQRDTAERALVEAREQLDQLAMQQSDAASSHDEQMQSLANAREELRIAQDQLRAADAGRLEIEARLNEMTQAASDAQTRLETAQVEQRKAIAETEQRVRAEQEIQLKDLKSELESARTALARQMAERGNLEQATQSEFNAVQKQQREALDQAKTALEESEQSLVEARAAEKALTEQLAEARATAKSQQQALAAELEQLRMATTTDIEATQKQLQQIKEELKAARKVSAGGSVNEELEKLRLLLDGAREEASHARADAEQWREHALSETTAAAEQGSDELAALRVQLADVQCRVEEATQLREKSQQEVAQLRNELQAQQLRQSVQDVPVQTTVLQEDAPARRGGLWMGLAAGLLLGMIGAGGALWYGQSAPVPGTVEPVVATPAPMTVSPTQSLPAVKTAEPEKKVVAAPVITKAEARTPAVEPVAKLRELSDRLSDGSSGPLLIDIPAASYSMGSGASSLDFDERPKHDVQLPRFAIGKYEVTFDEYDAFARMTGRAMPDDKGWGRGQRPVINVSWEEALTYTRWLSEQTGKRYRLATEAEWEYAAGGTARTLYWWGNSPGEGRANCFNCGSEWDAHQSGPVGSFAANPLGLHDSSGNVAEWVQDCYHPSYEGAPSDGSAWNTVGCTRHVVRGGGFNSPANTLRLTKRDQQLSSMRSDDLGFRVVREY
ncbi:MAG: SUMF1/EgtB/PvdO family nonheme iron enzyme [Gammaproteobacteria bacterium]|nr:SUMF1/EgtB/PvdO family nonheme iron enzyme [Gammaproteobacteria bacterium]